MSRIAVDSSAILAIALGEPDALALEEALLESEPLMSVATRIELAHVALRRLGKAGVAEIETLLADFGVRFAPMDEEQSETAVKALLAYGKGRGEAPAALNLGDTFSYALAKTCDLPLLYKGDDFSRTDVRSALDTDSGPE